jgi:N-acetylglucosaminyldiphosphoundecaprenol N-acetyl-beta-D-mannosaminyltransferase
MEMTHRTILGIRFFQGSIAEAVELVAAGGLALFPAAPALKDIATNEVYRSALLGADYVLPDSAFMVMLWNRIERDNIKRLSGLTYLRELLTLPSFRQTGNTLWIMPDHAAVRSTQEWLNTQGINVPSSQFYEAPMYTITDVDEVIDARLLVMVEEFKPQHIVLGIGGGTQEPLGYNLKKHLSYRPSIHCVGAAVGFLTGEQAAIPVWADRFYLGWLLRTLNEPGRFGRRYWEARKLYPLLRQWRDRLPPLQKDQG